MTEAVVVVGGGIMGSGIAVAMALAGHAVTVCEPDDDTASGLPRRLGSLLHAETDRAPAGGAAPARIEVVAELEPSVAVAGLVIEAVPEQMALKSEVWSRLGVAAPREAILATNTSALDVDALAALVPAPERVLGTHWFNPAPLIPCVEVVRGRRTSPEVAARVLTILRRAGKQPVEVGNSPGFVANRIQFALVREALLCLEEGLASAEDIDTIVSSSFGVRLAALGPLANADLGGLDTYHRILEFLAGERGERFAPPRVLADNVRAGRHGAKTGAGLGDYPGDAAERLALRRDERLRRVIAALDEEE